MTRVVVVDDHVVVRAALCRVLHGESDIDVVGETGSGREAVELCRQLRPRVVLLDQGLPDLDGIDATRQITSMRCPPRVLILGTQNNDDYATCAVRAGASGFIAKDASSATLLEALRKIARRGVYLSRTVMERLVATLSEAETPPETTLTERERQVLAQLASGASSREVSHALGLSLSTIETYRRRVLDKLDLRNNAELTLFAIRRGLVAIEDP